MRLSSVLLRAWVSGRRQERIAATAVVCAELPMAAVVRSESSERVGWRLARNGKLDISDGSLQRGMVKS